MLIIFQNCLWNNSNWAVPQLQAENLLRWLSCDKSAVKRPHKCVTQGHSVVFWCVHAASYRTRPKTWTFQALPHTNRKPAYLQEISDSLQIFKFRTCWQIKNDKLDISSTLYFITWSRPPRKQNQLTHWDWMMRHIILWIVSTLV